MSLKKREDIKIPSDFIRLPVAAHINIFYGKLLRPCRLLVLSVFLLMIIKQIYQYKIYQTINA